MASVKDDRKTNDEECDATEAKSGNKCSDKKRKKLKAEEEKKEKKNSIYSAKICAFCEKKIKI